MPLRVQDVRLRIVYNEDSVLGNPWDFGWDEMVRENYSHVVDVEALGGSSACSIGLGDVLDD